MRSCPSRVIPRAIPSESTQPDCSDEQSPTAVMAALSMHASCGPVDRSCNRRQPRQERTRGRQRRRPVEAKALTGLQNYEDEGRAP